MQTQHKLLTLWLALSIMSSCSKDFYSDINSAPLLRISSNASIIDTVKTSAKSLQRTYEFTLSAEDVNGNMSSLWTSVNNADLLFDNIDINGKSLAIELSKEKFEFARNFTLRPTSNGMHILRSKVKDGADGVSNILEKHIYSFDNMRPVVDITYTAKRRNLSEVDYYIDISKSFDRDAKWGGGLDTIYIHYYSNNGTEDFGREVWDYWNFPIKEDKTIYNTLMFDDGVNCYTDMWVWVKDNEGMNSDTLHFEIGHVE
ncbi:MAG: hypothetical protein ACRC3G_01505 [Bacteroidales bacterium]